MPSDEEASGSLARRLGISDVLARLLWNRQLRTEEDARRFLAPEERQESYDPFLMRDMERAVQRISAAIDGEERITIYGDYDVDGMTATALLYRCLRGLGAQVDFYIPDRFTEGYGFHLAALERIAASSSLLVSVDCGIASVADVAAMAGRLDIIITDHHLPGEALPPALAVVNPHRADCPYPDKDLCGVGVAYKLCEALYQARAHRSYGKDIELVALGTIADIVPLVGENRKIVRLGLARMKDTESVGLRALMEVAGVEAEKLGAEQVGFQLAPRLNAAGRMERATLGARLLLTQDAAEAQELAGHLDALNRQRQAVEQDILCAAEAELAAEDVASLPAIVLAGEGWHQGVIGIVASRLVEKYYKPVVILSVNGAMAKGSCRSIEGLHIYEALKACERFLVGFGGHAQAAGLSLRTADIPAFRRAFEETVRRTLRPEDYVPVACIEFEMDPCAVTTELVEEIARLEPYGEGNPRPLFGCRNLRGSGARRIGSEGQHLKFVVEDADHHAIDFLYWGQGALAGLVNAEPLDIVYKPSINEWRGIRKVQAIVDSINPAAGARVHPDRDTLADIYRYLFRLAAGGAPLSLDPWELTAGFRTAMGHGLSLFTMKEGLRVFLELGLLREASGEDAYAFCPPARKLDLKASPTYRRFLGQAGEL